MNHLYIFFIVLSLMLCYNHSFADFPVKTGDNRDAGPVVVYNSTDHEYLVVSIELIKLNNLYIPGPVKGQRVDEDGSLIGSEFTIFTNATSPSVVYNSGLNQYLVAATGNNGIVGQRVSSTGTLVGNSVLLLEDGLSSRLLYNSLEKTYLLASEMIIENSGTPVKYKYQFYTKRINADLQALGLSELIVNGDWSTGRPGLGNFSIAYAPVSSPETPSGRYLLIWTGSQPLMLNSEGAVIYTVYDPYHPGVEYKEIPFSYGSNVGGVFNVDVAYGMNAGTGAFLVVWGDNNNSYSSEAWTGIWGNFVDPYKLDYTIDDPVPNTAFPVSAIAQHYVYDAEEYAQSWKPKVTYNYPAQKFMVVWRETPGNVPENDTKVNHIRADKVWKAITYNPNVVISETSGDENPKNPALAVSTINPHALVVWEDYRDSAATDCDIYANIFSIPAAPSVKLIQPDGGEYWKVASQQEIKWTNTSFSDPVKIEYSTDGGTNYSVITNSTSNDGSYMWTVPNSPSAFCIVRVKDASDNDPSDVSDAVFSIFSNIKKVVNTNESGLGTLRQAILDANANPGTDTINFEIPGTGYHTITLTSELPEITDPVVIDGYSQPGSSPNNNPITEGMNAVLKIELKGSNDNDRCGLRISGGNSTVRGLVINGFDKETNEVGRGIILEGNGSNRIEGNFIGTDITGTGKSENHTGILVSFHCNNNIIGGTDAGKRNLVSGNHWGIVILGDSNYIKGNFVGTDVSGSNPLPNFDGIHLIGGGIRNRVGGSTEGTQNIISGNTAHGIMVNNSSNNIIEGNFIGTESDGNTPLGNYYGIFVARTTFDNLIGGTTTECANIIACNSVGINIGEFVFDLEDCTGNRIGINSIFNNTDLGIDLSGISNAGVSVNDQYDSDAGPNNFQNYPHLLSVENDIVTSVSGVLNSTPSTTFRINFYSSPAGNPSGYGEGKTFLGFTELTTDANGEVDFITTFGELVPETCVITATAADPEGNTSEFSNWIAAVMPEKFTVTNVNNAGEGSLRQAIIDANAKEGPDTIAFDISGTGPFTISPLSELPVLSDPVIINGFTQPGSNPNTNLLNEGSDASLMIQLNGNNIGAGKYGLKITGGSSIVKGMVINNFKSSSGSGGFGIWLSGNGSNVVEGNYIGTAADGNTSLSNHSGIMIDNSSGNRIGGTTPGARNIISGNAMDQDAGINIMGEEADCNTILGNYIGTTASGLIHLSNDTGIDIYRGDYNRIGGSGEGGNIISGNNYGINLLKTSSNNIEENYIGLDRSGTVKLGNTNGISLFDSCSSNYIMNNMIGGNNTGIFAEGNSCGNLVANNMIGTDEQWEHELGNTQYGIYIADSLTDNNMIENNSIGFNGGCGVFISRGNGNYLSRNRISANTGKGITNDSGGNDEIAPPVINFSSVSEISGSAGPGYIVEIFADEEDEGKYYLGTVTADFDGNFQLIPDETPPAPSITATCTDQDGNTSEFSIPDYIVPVELFSLQGVTIEAGAMLKWSTGSEVNNSGYEIQRSRNGKDFVKAGFVEGNGTKPENSSYSFIDRNLSAGLYFYRLKQINLDGTCCYSFIVEVTVNPPSIFELAQNYPNPFNSQTTISYKLPKRIKVQIKIYDITGQETAVLVNEEEDAGYYSISWNSMDSFGRPIASGVYICSMNAGDYFSCKKLVLLK